MDAFEQNLRDLFEGCADFVDGRIGSTGLQELCDTLDVQQLKTDFAESVHRKGVTYADFKLALTKLWGQNYDTRNRGGHSPAREVSPKYIFGKKKYGRRSRPDSTECDSNLIDGVEACSMTEQTAVKKRKTDEDGEDSALPLDASGAEDDEEMLVAAWAAVASPAGRLSKQQLVHVFQKVGLENGSEEAAGSVFEKLNLGDEGITLDVLLTFIRGGAPLCRDTKNIPDFTDSTTASIDYIDNTSGFISGNHLIELWENAGLSDSVSLLLSLGYQPYQQCDFANLTSRFHGLLKGVRDEKQILLLRAGLILQRAYIHSLKGVVEQVSGENEKLKADVSEANHRAQMLAQEVDEHHTRQEASTLRRVKELEQRHSEKVRELTEQVKVEQDQLCQQNQMLEKRIALLEGEESKARTELSMVQNENSQLQSEHQTLLEQLASLQKEKEELQRNVHELSAVHIKLQELEESMRDKDVLALLDRVAGLESENRTLRDRNDELSLQVEDLSCRLQIASINKRPSQDTPLSLHVDAAMRDVVDLDATSDEFSEVAFEKTLGCELADNPAKGVSGGNPIVVNKKTTENSASDAKTCLLKLERTISESLKLHYNSEDSMKTGAVINDVISAVANDENKCNCNKLQGTIQALSEEFTNLKNEDGKLRERCQQLEKSIELLQDEYEKTEDYWTSKLEEERQLFDAEQRQSDDKYSELVNKILEYEEMMKREITATHGLETIEEKDGLEKQVAELEEEYSKLLAEKDDEITKLQEELDFHPPVVDALSQTEQMTAECVPEASQPRVCRRSLTFTSGDRRRHCCKVYRLQAEVKSLIEAKQAAQRDLTALLAERDYLYKQVLARRHEGNCCAGLNSKLLCAERKCRSLVSTLRNQQLQTSELLRSTWQQHKREVDELRSVLAVTEGKLHQQTIQIQQQLSQMAAHDIVVKDLFVENSYLVARVRKLETSRSRFAHSSQ